VVISVNIFIVVCIYVFILLVYLYHDQDVVFVITEWPNLIGHSAFFLIFSKLPNTDAQLLSEFICLYVFQSVKHGIT